jgi:isopentenyl-diphosphate delta-isomerase
MAKVAPLQQRKADHILINLEKDVRSALTSGLERYRFVHEALPELNLEDVDTSLALFGRRLAAPILVSSMTGGTEQAGTINRRLAEAAQEMRVAMGVGSQRTAFEHEEQTGSFQVRKYAPDILLFANLGAVQLNYGYDIDHCRRAVEMIGADALYLHLNPVQEAVQEGGDTDFSGLAAKIAAVCRALPVPVIVKEVGWGIAQRTAKLLTECGVAAIDVAGAGGTSWSQVEMHRAATEFTRELAATLLAQPKAQRVVHEMFGLRDLRRTAETALARMGVSKDVRGQIQSHGLGGVQTRHYDRHDYMQEKTAALDAWVRYLEAAPAVNVRPLRARGRR